MREITRQPQPIACTLGGDEVDVRLAEWRSLLDAVTERVAIDGGVGLRLPLRPDLAAKTADLAAREQSCCAFFDFTLRLVPDALWLEVRAPDDARPIVETLFGAPAPD